MASYNKVILIGNLTRDPQVKYLPSGTAVAEIGLAVNRTWFDKQSNSRKEEVTFVDVTLWDRTAEVAGEYLTKGKQVLIEGRLQMDSWEDRETKQKRTKLKIVGETMTMLGSRNDAGGTPGGAGSNSRGSAAPSGRDGGDSEQGGFSQDIVDHPSFEDTSSGSSNGPSVDEVPF